MNNSSLAILVGLGTAAVMLGVGKIADADTASNSSKAVNDTDWINWLLNSQKVPVYKTTLAAGSAVKDEGIYYNPSSKKVFRTGQKGTQLVLFDEPTLTVAYQTYLAGGKLE